MRESIREPFAVELYRRYQHGETVDSLAAKTGIPRDRIEIRIRAAARYLHSGETDAATAANRDHSEILARHR